MGVREVKLMKDFGLFISEGQKCILNKTLMLKCYKINFMKIEFENSIRRLSFLCRLTGIKIAWINPCQGKIFSFFKLRARRCVSSHPKISEKYFFFHKNMQKFFQVGFFSFLGLELEIGPSSCSIHYWHVPLIYFLSTL